MTSEWLDYSCSLADLTFDIAFYEHECIKNMTYEATFSGHVCILGIQIFEASFIEFVCVLIEEVTTTTTQIPTTTTTTTIAPVTTSTTTAEVTTTTTTQGIYPVKYGALYNWYVGVDARNIAAAGWRVITYTDITNLETYLGGASVSGGKIKEAGLAYWNTPNTGATNEVGFNARGIGSRNGTNGAFEYIKQNFTIWTSEVYVAGIMGKCKDMAVYSSTSSNGIGAGFSFGKAIRLVKTTTTLTHGQTGTYTGNDGKIYRTICIGTQEWLADNLLETKYRNGDWIHGFDGGVYTPISNAAWILLTSEGMCFYTDLESNG
jgi:uncharacterized protein (TIGR02145 family)